MKFDLKEMHCKECSDGFSYGDIFYVEKGEIYCRYCGLEVSGKKQCYVIDNTEYHPVLDLSAYNELECNTYSIGKISKHFFINGTFDKNAADKSYYEFVEETVNNGFPVIEKNLNGLAIRFSENHIVKKEDFGAKSPIAKDYMNLLTRMIHTQQVSYICDDDNVAGAVFSDDTESFELVREYEIISREEFEKNAHKSVAMKKMRKALNKVNPADMLKYFEKRIIGQREELKKLACIFYEYFVCMAKGRPVDAYNLILTAPSGCGKTELYRVLRDFCKEYNIPVPVMLFDLSLFTEAGYKGKETEEIAGKIAEASKESGGYAICFLDEADKKFVPSYGSNSIDNNAATQANLLTLVEGREIKAEDSDIIVDTGKTMFVFMGAFQSLRDKKDKSKKAVGRLGFGFDNGENNEQDKDFYSDITIDEIVEYGMLEELAGRVLRVVNFHRLSEKDMRRLLVQKTRMISGELNVEIELTDEAKDSLIEISYSHFGIRNQMNRIRSLAVDKLSEYYFDKGFDKQNYKIIIKSADEAEICRQYIIKEKAS